MRFSEAPAAAELAALQVVWAAFYASLPQVKARSRDLADGYCESFDHQLTTTDFGYRDRFFFRSANCCLVSAKPVTR